MELTVEILYGLLQRSRLVSPQEAQPLLQRWQEESRGAAGDLEHFQRWLVANRYVTEYQAGLLARLFT